MLDNIDESTACQRKLDVALEKIEQLKSEKSALENQYSKDIEFFKSKHQQELSETLLKVEFYKKEAAFYKRLVDLQDDPIFVHDALGVMIYGNPACNDFLGAKSSLEAIGLTKSDALNNSKVNKEWLEKCYDQNEGVALTGKSIKNFIDEMVIDASGELCKLATTRKLMRKANPKTGEPALVSGRCIKLRELPLAGAFSGIPPILKAIIENDIIDHNTIKDFLKPFVDLKGVERDLVRIIQALLNNKTAYGYRCIMLSDFLSKETDKNLSIFNIEPLASKIINNAETYAKGKDIKIRADQLGLFINVNYDPILFGAILTDLFCCLIDSSLGGEIYLSVCPERINNQSGIKINLSNAGPGTGCYKERKNLSIGSIEKHLKSGGYCGLGISLVTQILEKEGGALNIINRGVVEGLAINAFLPCDVTPDCPT